MSQTEGIKNRNSVLNRVGKSAIFVLKGQCHAIRKLYKNLEGVFASTEFQN